MIRLNILKLAILTVPTLVASSTTSRILATENIGETVRSQRASPNARFSISAEKEDGTSFAFDVVEASNPAMSPDTILKNRRGQSSAIGEGVLHTLLVSDASETFALLAVDPDDNVAGIVDKGSKPFKIRQEKGKKVKALEETNLTPPDWSCEVDHEDVEPKGVFDRQLEEEQEHHHDHDHDHDHHHHHHDHQVESAMQTLSKQLRGTKINPLNKPRRLQSAAYNYQVDLYMEIDNAFVTRAGGSVTAALNYVNSLVTAANVIYEKEIDTHLHVAVIDLNTNYDASTSTSGALTEMRAIWAAGTWHTQGIDLHHALLGKGLGGGIAYVGVLCRSDYGYGLTASIGGSFVSLDYRVVWDLVAFMHEIGHNFASRHTHDTNGYSPVIDTCGSTCPADSSNIKWSTIMSYCHLCQDGYSNQMYTFGGSYDGSGTKTDIANWINNPELEANYNSVRYSTDPRREAFTMFSHVKSKEASGCLAVPVVVTPSPTDVPVTASPTKAPVTASPTKAPATASPTKAPVSSAPVTASPTKAPVSSAPVTASPTKAPVTSAPVTASPTRAPTTKSPTAAPVTSPPTAATNCEDPSISQEQCIAAPNCEWVKVKRNRFCQFSTSNPNPPSPTPPTTPNPTDGGGGGTCDPVGAACSAGSSNCCNGCQLKGRWANTCK
jgi:hypothetical protein